MPIRIKANNGNIDLQVPIKGGAVNSVNGQVGDVVLDIPSKTSQLENDSDFATSAAVSNAEEKINHKLGSYALKTEIPDVEGFATKSEVQAVEDKIPSLDNYATKDELFSKDYNDLTNKPTIPSIDGLATKLEVKEVENKIPSLNGYATEQWVEGKGYLTEHQSLADYATKAELAAKQDTLTAGTNITIENGVISASGGGSGSDIKSINLNSRKISIDYVAEYKELLTYLWGTGEQGYVDLTKCIVTINGMLINQVYVRSPYIYFYPTVSSNFTPDGLSEHFYICNYTKAMTASGDYQFITMSQYATTLLTSDNYSQYISTSGNYTTDVSDGNLPIASELYVGISTSDGRKSSVNIKLPQNYVLNEKTNEYFYFPESESSNGYVYYDGNSLNVSGSNTIEYIWYK